MKNLVVVVAGLAGLACSASAQNLFANTDANNGGATGWAIFSDFRSTTGSALVITDMTTASTAAAFASFDVEVFVFDGSAIDSPGATVGFGAGSSSVGWTSLGFVTATQGALANGVSDVIDIPDIVLPGDGSTVGVAFLFTGAGPRYFGTGTAPTQTFSGGGAEMLTGSARSVPFTATGSVFASRAHVGACTVIPAPATAALLGLGGLVATRRRR